MFKNAKDPNFICNFFFFFHFLLCTSIEPKIKFYFDKTKQKNDKNENNAKKINKKAILIYFK